MPETGVGPKLNIGIVTLHFGGVRCDASQQCNGATDARSLATLVPGCRKWVTVELAHHQPLGLPPDFTASRGGKR
jgi:hypothetical protein